MKITLCLFCEYILINWIGLTKSLFPTSIIVGAESSTFSRRLSEAQKQQDELDDDEGTIAFSKNMLAEKKKPAFSKNLLAEKKKPKYVPTFFWHSFSGSVVESTLIPSLMQNCEGEEQEAGP
jgi:hypothetical protein